jgi:sugar phosphate isomerase/epimerase
VNGAGTVSARSAAETGVGGGAGIAAFEYGISLEDKLARVRALGATNCELAVPGDVTPDSVAAVAEAAAAAGVRVTAVASLSKPNLPGGEAEGLRLLEDSIECAAALRAPFAIAYFGANADRPAAEAIRRYVELTRPCLERAAERGVTVLIENHFSHALGDVTSGPDGCAELIAAVGLPSFGLNFDPCNFAIAGVDLAAAYAQLKGAIRNVHIKDARPYDPARDADYPGRVVEDVHRGRFVFVPVGEGITDNDVVLDALAADGYQGPVTVEAHTPADTLDAVFAQGLRYWRERGR